MGLKPGTPRFLWCGSRLQLLAPCPCGVSEILFMISWSLKFFFFGWSFDLRAGVLKVLKFLQDHHRTLFGGLPLVGVGRDGVARQNSDLTSSFTSILHPPSSIVLPRLRWRLGASNVAQTGKSKPAKAAKVADDVSHSNVASWLKKTWDHMSSRAGKVGSECK